MENNLTFLKTWTLEQFKKENNVQEIKVCRCKTTNARFFVYGSQRGWVAKEGIPQHPVISLVEDQDGNKFTLMHKEAELDVEAVF